LLGGLPKDEDQVPALENNGQPTLFDFFGLGQPRTTPPNQPNINLNEEVSNI
jgi:hypothetical protein